MHPETYHNTDWNSGENMPLYPEIDVKNVKYPFCIVWTPIPVLTWLFPFLGHMGIATSSGVIRDFAGPYFVSEDNMAFGKPVKYWQLDPKKVHGGAAIWDQAISEAADVYKTRMHNLCCDNCHSMVAMALNKMYYDNRDDWGMVSIGFKSFFNSQYISLGARLKTYFPFTILLCLLALVIFSTNYQQIKTE